MSERKGKLTKIYVDHDKFIDRFKYPLPAAHQNDAHHNDQSSCIIILHYGVLCCVVLCCVVFSCHVMSCIVVLSFFVRFCLIL
jgi:hypothetical protein